MNFREWVELYQHHYKFNIIPLKSQSKEPAVPTWKEYQDTQYTGEFFEGHNIGVICGKQSKVIVLDLDSKDLFREIFDKPEEILSRTLVTETNRGHHIFCIPKDNFFPPNMKLKDAQGRSIDIKSEGGYVVVPPSIHPDGGKYKVISYSKEIMTVDLVAVIEKLKTKYGFTGGLQKAKLDEVKNGKISEGSRNDSAYIMSRYLLNPTEGARGQLEAWDELQKWNEANMPPLDKDELLRTFESASSIPFEERPIEFDKKSFKRNYVARHITVTLHPKTLRENDEIYIYRNGLYIASGETHIKEMLHRLYYGIPQSEVHEVLATIRSTTYVENSDFDTYPEMIHASNCLVNVKTMNVFEQTPAVLTRNQLNCIYDPNARCPNIIKFLSEVMPEPGDLKSLIEMLSTILIHKIKLEKAFIFVGDQANGKSTLIELIIDLLGENNVSNVSLQNLSNNHFATSTMLGKILNAYGDLDISSIQQTGMIKQIISHDHIMVEKKNKNAFSTKIPIRLLFSANGLPELKNSDEAIFRRFWVIKFPIIIPPEKRNLRLLETLTLPQEKSGFLNILIKNANQLMKNNFTFTHPQRLEETKTQWLSQSDSISAYVESELVVNPDFIIKTVDLYEYYKKWCIDNKKKIMSDRLFFGKITQLGPFTKGTNKIGGKTVNSFRGAKPKKVIAEERIAQGQSQL